MSRNWVKKHMLNCQIPKGICNLMCSWIKNIKEILTSGSKSKTILNFDKLSSLELQPGNQGLTHTLDNLLLVFFCKKLSKLRDLYWTCLCWKYQQFRKPEFLPLICIQPNLVAICPKLVHLEGNFLLHNDVLAQLAPL